MSDAEKVWKHLVQLFRPGSASALSFLAVFSNGQVGVSTPGGGQPTGVLSPQPDVGWAWTKCEWETCLTKGSSLPLQNIPPWDSDYFRLITSKKQQTWEKLWKPSRKYLCKGHLCLWVKAPSVRVSSSLCQACHHSQREGTNLNQWKNFTLVYCVLPGNLP